MVLCKKIIHIKMIVSIAFACLGLAGFAQEKTGVLQQSREPWNNAIENYNFQLAIELLNEQIGKMELVSLQDSLRMRTLLLQKASCEKNLYKFQDAIATLTDVLGLAGEEDPTVFASLAECHRLSGNYNAAMIFYSLAIEMMPGNSYFRIQKALLHYRIEDFTGCIGEGKKIITQDSTYSIMTLLGDSFNRLQQADSAIWYYNWAYGRNPGDYKVLEKLSGIYLGRKQFDTVARMTSNFLAGDSTNVVITPILGVALHGMGKYKESYAVFEKALALGCDKLSGYYYQGLNKMMLKEYFDAREWFRKAYDLDTNDVNLMYYTAFCHFKMGSYRKYSEEMFDKIEQMLQPDPAMMFKINVTRAEMYMHDDRKAVIRYFKKAQDYGELSPVHLSNIGYAYRMLKDYDNALKYYNQYLAVGKKDTSIWKFVQEEIAFIKEEQFMQGK